MLVAVAMAVAVAMPAPPPPPGTIVVTGIRLAELKVADERCARDGCGIRDDIIAAVRYADALFFGGRYDEAARVLGRSVARNRGRSAEDPRAMAELYVAQANVAKHFGDPTRESIALQGSGRVLKDNLAAGDRGVLVSDLDVGDLFLSRGDNRYAEARYAAVAKQARASGRMVMARSAEVRGAWVLVRRGRIAEAKARLAELAALPGADMRDIRLVARILQYRIAWVVKDTAAKARLLAAIASEPPARPLLLWEPPLPEPDGSGIRDPETGIVKQTVTGVDLRWADIEFEITPAGTVKDVEVIRGPGDHGWVMPVVATIKERIYTPIRADVDAPANVRTERYSLTATFEKPINSNIARRVDDARFERLDITQPPSPPPAASPPS